MCLPSHLHLPDLYLKYHLLSILLQITVILNVHATSLVEGRLVETLFFLDEELPCGMFKSESVAKRTVLFWMHFYFYLLYLVHCEDLEYMCRLAEQTED